MSEIGMTRLHRSSGERLLPALGFVLLAGSLLCGLDIILVVFGGGVSIGFAGFQIRSTTIEFQTIGLVLTGLTAFLVAGKWREAALVCVALMVAGLIAELLLRALDHPLSKAHLDYTAWYKPSDYYGHELAAGFEGFARSTCL